MLQKEEAPLDVDLNNRIRVPLRFGFSLNYQQISSLDFWEILEVL